MDDRLVREEFNELRRLVELERGDRHTADDDIRKAYRLDLDSLRREFAGYMDRTTQVLREAVDASVARSRERVAPHRQGWRADWTSLIDSGVMSFRCTRPRELAGVPLNRQRATAAMTCDHIVHVHSGDSFLTLSNKLRKHVRDSHPGDHGNR